MVSNGVSGWTIESPGGIMHENIDTPKSKASKSMPEPDRSSPEKSQAGRSIIKVEDVNFYYGEAQALKSINIEIPEK